jgi:hypothetical protein
MDFYPELILKDAIQNDKITIEKCRKLALLAGASPQTFFINKNKKSIIIDTKASLVNQFLNESHESTITNYLPVGLQQLLGVGKNMGGNYITTLAVPSLVAAALHRWEQSNEIELKRRKAPTPTDRNNRKRTKIGNLRGTEAKNIKEAAQKAAPTAAQKAAPTAAQKAAQEAAPTAAQEAAPTAAQEAAPTAAQEAGSKIDESNKGTPIVKYATIAFIIAGFLYILNKGLTKYRLYKIIHKDEKTIQDKVQSIELFNDGYYNGCLAHDKSLHEIFKKSYMYNETVEKLRYRLLTEWETSYIGQHYLMSIHLIRNNGSVRDTAEEIANAISYHTSLFGIGSRKINSLLTNLFGRRLSSQGYLNSKKKKEISKHLHLKRSSSLKSYLKPSVSKRMPSKRMSSKRMPSKRIPSTHMPSKRLPSKHLPSKHLPSKHLPSKRMSSKRLPSKYLYSKRSHHKHKRSSPKRSNPKHKRVISSYFS